MKYSGYAEELTEQLIRMVEKEQAPWQKGYNSNHTEPTSYGTDKSYQGANAMRLWLTSLEKGHTDNRWITKNQAIKEGGSVKGEGTPILFFTDEKYIKAENPETGEKELKKVKLSRPVLKVSKVYNISEVDGIEVKEAATPESLGWKQADLLNEIKQLTKADISHSGSPAYFPEEDKISLPRPEDYTDPRRYASGLLHETTHWTGNEKRLDRKFGMRGTSGYAREELVAEISTMLIGGRTGIDTNIENNEAYVKNWWQPLKQHLRENPNEIMKICKDAYKARDYICEGKELERLEKASVSHKVELSEDEKKSGRINLDIAFSEKNGAKTLAKSLDVDLKWDRAEKTWYANVEDGQNIGNLAQYRISPDTLENAPANDQINTLKEEVTHEFSNGASDVDIILLYDKIDVIAKNTETDFDTVLNSVTEGLEDKEEVRERVSNEKPETNRIGFAVVDPINGQVLTFSEKLDEVKEAAKALEVNHDFKDMNSPIYEVIKNAEGKNKLGEKLGEITPENNIDMKKEETTEIPERVNFKISFKQKDEAKEVAKSLGIVLKWDKPEKTWYAKTTPSLAEKLNSHLGEKQETKAAQPAQKNYDAKAQDDREKVYLDIPFDKKDQIKREAKESGATLKWDSEAKHWHTYKDEITPVLETYLPQKVVLNEAAKTESIYDALSNAGVGTPPAEINLDGKFHRLKATGDKKGESSISYKGYNNGVPNAVITNHKTGIQVKWVGKSPELTAEERKQLVLDNKNNEEQSKAKMKVTRDYVATISKQDIEKALPAPADHPYLTNKGILTHDLKVNKRNELLVTVQNTNGETRSIQRITEKGDKMYSKGGEKTGNFHAFGEMKNGKPIIIAEGLATSATVFEVTGVATVAAFDSGNLKDVGKNIATKYPDSPIIFAADNDHTKEGAKNVGVYKAMMAASELGKDKAQVVFPYIEKGRKEHAHITDFNDVKKAFGPNRVSKEIGRALVNTRIKEEKEAQKQIAPAKKAPVRRSKNNDNER